MIFVKIKMTIREICDISVGICNDLDMKNKKYQ